RAQTESAPNAPEALLEDPNSPLVIAGQILCVVLPLAVWFAPLPLAPATKHGFAIVGFMGIAWITRAMDYALAGFIGCFLFWALGIVKFPVAFSGFANDTAWFLFGALLLGVIATRSGVARGLAEAFDSPPGKNISRGMFLILSYTANIFDKMIIAGAGSITARGLIEQVGGVEVLWSYWFIAFLPCSIITVLAAWALTLWLYPPEHVSLHGGYEFL